MYRNSLHISEWNCLFLALCYLKTNQVNLKQCYLMASDPNDPCGRHYKGSMSSYWTRLLNLLQHEAGHFVVVLKRKNTIRIHVVFEIWRSEKNRHFAVVQLKSSQRSIRLTVWLSKQTHCLFAPGAADGHDLFTVKSKLLLKALNRKTKTISFIVNSSIKHIVM